MSPNDRHMARWRFDDGIVRYVSRDFFVESKADYVRKAKQTREHDCHWPGCGKQVPPAMWGCLKHWKMLPRVLQLKIWAAYKPGQEETLDVSEKYVKVAREVQEWIANREKGSTTELSSGNS